MEDVSRNQGRTVLFVSHNMPAVLGLCNRGLLLTKGCVSYLGATKDTINEYLLYSKKKLRKYQAAPKNEIPSVVSATVITSEPNGSSYNGKPLTIEFILHTPRKISSASFSFQIADELENKIVYSWVFDSEIQILRNPGYFRLTCRMDKLRLYMGEYTLYTYLGSSRDRVNFEVLENICPFKVEMYDQFREYEWQSGAAKYLEDVKWTVEEYERIFDTNFQVPEVASNLQ